MKGLPGRKKRPKEDTEGESFNQPNNYSKLTDSNNCMLIIFLVSSLIAFLSTPLRPVSSSGRSAALLAVCVPRHVTHVLDVGARGLLIKDFWGPPMSRRRGKSSTRARFAQKMRGARAILGNPSTF
jgi:hypothetical protein